MQSVGLLTQGFNLEWPNDAPKEGLGHNFNYLTPHSF